MLEVAITKQRRGLRVQAAFQLEAGGALGLFGPTGAGKSTLLACIAGVETPDAGQVRWNGQVLFPPALPLHRRRLGYLTQEPNLFPHLSVADNITFGLTRGADAAWVAHLRDRLQLGGVWQARATQVSGGQARQVALARMLARRPQLVLLDEPFAGLDRASVRQLIASLLDWRAELGFALIAVDHQAEVLSRLCPRALALRAGRVTAQGSWAQLRATADPELEALLAPL